MRSFPTPLACSLVLFLAAACRENGPSAPQTSQRVASAPEAEVVPALPTATHTIPPATPQAEPLKRSVPIELPSEQVADPVLGLSLAEILSIASAHGFPVQEKIHEVRQAEAEIARIESGLLVPREEEYSEGAGSGTGSEDGTGSGSGSGTGTEVAIVIHGPRLLDPSELEQINAAIFQFEAERSALSLTAADHANAAHREYLDLQSERSKVRSVRSMQSFLASIDEIVATLVASGEAPPTWQDLIRASTLENERTAADASGRLAAREAALVRSLGKYPGRDLPTFADVPMPDLTNAPVPDLSAAIATAVARSFAISELRHRREAIASRIRGLNFLLVTSILPPAQMEHIHAIEVEEAKAEVLAAEIRGSESRIGETIVAAQAALGAVSTGYKTLDASVASLESAFASARAQLENGDLDLFEIVALAQRLVEARNQRDFYAIKWLGHQADVDRALLVGPYEFLKPAGGTPW